MIKNLAVVLTLAYILSGVFHISPELYAKEEDRGIRARLESAQKSFSKFKKRFIKNYKKRSRRQKVAIGAAAVVGGAGALYLGSIATRVALALYRGDQKTALELAKDIPAGDVQKLLQFVGGYLNKLSTEATSLMPAWMKRTEPEFPEVDDAEQLRRFMEFVPEGKEREWLKKLVYNLPKDEKFRSRLSEIQKLRSSYPQDVNVAPKPFLTKKMTEVKDFFKKDFRGKRLALMESIFKKNIRETKLSEVIKAGDNEKLLDLLASGKAEVDKDFDLYWAVHSNNPDAAKLLIKSGVKPDSKYSYVHLGHRNTSPLGFAAGTGADDVARVLLDEGARVDAGGVAPLQIALEEGSIGVAKMLIKAGAKISKKGSYYFATAIEKGYNDIVELLIKKGADVRKTYGPYSLLTIAVESDNIDAAKLLVDAGADVNSGKVYTPLTKAIEEGHYKFVEFLLKEGADPNNIPEHGFEGWTPLHHAAKRGDQNIIKLLIEWGVGVNKQNRYGIRTPLDVAKNFRTKRLLRSFGGKKWVEI